MYQFPEYLSEDRWKKFKELKDQVEKDKENRPKNAKNIYQLARFIDFEYHKLQQKIIKRGPKMEWFNDENMDDLNTDLENLDEISLYDKASKLGHSGAMFEMAKHLYHCGGEANKKAIDLLKKSSEKGNWNATNALAYWYLYIGSEVKLVIKCEDENLSKLSPYWVAELSEWNESNKPESPQFYYTKAYELFIKNDESGDRYAPYDLAIMYFYGKVIEKDYQKVIELLIRAFERGNSHAAYELGLLYLFGKGVEKNVEKGFEWLNKAWENEKIKYKKDFIRSDINFYKEKIGNNKIDEVDHLHKFRYYYASHGKYYAGLDYNRYEARMLDIQFSFSI